MSLPPAVLAIKYMAMCGLSQSQIAEELGVTQPAVSQAIARLHAKGESTEQLSGILVNGHYVPISPVRPLNPVQAAIAKSLADPKWRDTSAIAHHHGTTVARVNTVQAMLIAGGVMQKPVPARQRVILTEEQRHTRAYIKERAAMGMPVARSVPADEPIPLQVMPVVVATPTPPQAPDDFDDLLASAHAIWGEPGK